MTSLTAIFGNSKADAKESDKLRELYWDRAELKKEFANLREQKLALEEKLKSRDSEAIRARQKLEHLEQLLADPDWVHNVVLYYQLRGVNNQCRNKVARFSEHLKQQREQKQHSEVLDAWEKKIAAKEAELKKALGEHRMGMQLLEDKLQAERHRSATMGGVARFLQRGKLDANLEDIAAEIDLARAREAEMLAEIDALRSTDKPDVQGLDLTTKRSINFMILSYVQQLYLHFSDDDLAGLIKETGDKEPGVIRYGDRHECEQLLERVASKAAAADDLSNLVDVLQHRSRLIAENALFNEDDDSVPVPGTVATVYAIDSNGAVRQKDANLLEENYWNVAAVLSC